MIKKFTISSFRNIILSSRTRIRGLNIQQESNIELSFPRKRESRIVLSLREAVSLAAISLLTFFTLPSFAFAEEKIPVFPATPVEVYTVYGSLALFWLAIIFLIVTIKMKLNEIERIQKLGIDEENDNAPVLD